MCLCDDGYINVITGEVIAQLLYGVCLGQRGGIQYIHRRCHADARRRRQRCWLVVDNDGW